MKKKILLAGLFAAAVLLSNSCRSAQAGNDSLLRAEPTAEKQRESSIKQLPANQTVTFKGVSFSYDPQIFGEVKSEEVREQPLGGADHKPDNVYPRHLEFSLKDLKQNRDAHVSVFPIEDYRRMYAISKDATKMFDENLRAFRKIIKNKDFRTRRNEEVPYLPYMDASQTIKAKVRHFRFGSGRGFFFLTQYDQDYANLVNNDELVYIFQGISEDGKKYVLAKFPIKVSFLTDSESAYKNGFEGYRLPDNMIEESKIRCHKKYLADITKRLEDLPSDKYEPDLKYFEEIVSSLKVEK